MTARAPTPPRAFTLIELGACLVLLGLLAGLATLSLRSRDELARTEDVIAQLQRQDELLRTQARRTGRPVMLTFDTISHTLQRRVQDPSHDAAASSWVMPTGFTLEHVWVQDAVSPHRQVDVPCSSSGRTPTYALAMRGPSDRRTWIITAGLTGQQFLVEHEHQVQEVFDALTARPDAD